MGIKGRRKRLLRQQGKAQAEQDAAAADHDHDPNDDDDTEMEMTRMKKSDFFRLQDEAYLEHVREAHAQRRTSHLRPKASKLPRLSPDSPDHDAAAGEVNANDPVEEPSNRVDADQESHARQKRHAKKEKLEKLERSSANDGSLVSSGILHEDDTTDLAAAAIARRYLGHRFCCEADLQNATICLSSLSSSAAHVSGPVTSGQTSDSTSMRASSSVERSSAPFASPLLGLHPSLVSALRRENFAHMRAIQQRAIPYALAGHDLLGQARTGSGKTLAFVVPILQLAWYGPATSASSGFSSSSSPGMPCSSPAAASRFTTALVLGPTKELCVQICEVVQRLVQHLPEPRPALQLITGGTKLAAERRALAAGNGNATVVVGTPGRVHDHVRHCTAWVLHHIHVLVLDEADRMLADGFQRDLDAILARLPRTRQTLLFSATNSKSVQALARLSLTRAPLFVDTVAPAPLLIGVSPEASSKKSIYHPNNPKHEHEEAPLKQRKEQPGEHSIHPTADGGEEGEEEGVGLAGTVLGPYPDLSEHNPTEQEEEEGEENNQSNAGEFALDDDAAAIPSTLQQFCLLVRLEDRLRSLFVFMKRVARVSKAMVFCSSVASTTFHFQMMGSVGFHDDVMMLHGHLKHRQRLAVFEAFRARPHGVLFCTDVAARGLDIADVGWILQYDPPLDPTEYIHRIGRTARAGNIGCALLFLAPEEAGFIPYLAQFNIHLESYPMPSHLPPIQDKLEHVLQLDEVVAKSAVCAFRAHVGAYQSHLLKTTFDVHRLDLNRLATGFALTHPPSVSLPKNTAELRRREYVKGKLKSLNRRRLEALRYYEANKTKPQWLNGVFVGVPKV